ncbi:MAG: DEAD/DEAH box helicase, partial [Peptostreptococcaceae bacterium]
MKFTPVNASKNISKKYKRYLSTIFEISDDEYYNMFLNELNNSKSFEKGPFIDISDSFEQGNSLNELIEQKKVSKSFKKINIPHNRALYSHQQKSLEQVSSGQNVVVSTGTGSGKTESFLIPVLNDLLKEYESNTLCSGGRTLIIYPMNALANDQIGRMRKLLKNFPEITFGAYTGHTEEKENIALNKYY